MKQLLHLLLYIILSIQFVNGQIQDFEFTLYFEDAAGNKDSLKLGLNSAATTGIDSFLGETNIVDQPYQEGLDVRISDGWRRSQLGGDATFHTKKQIIEQYSEVLTIDINTTHFPVVAHWDQSLFSPLNIQGTLITSINPGGWWDTGSPSNLGMVLLAQQDAVVFTSNIATPFNSNYGYLQANDTIPVYWFTFGPEGIGVGTHDAKHSEFKIFPNPVSSLLQVEGFVGKEIDQIEIFTLSGESIRRFSGSDLSKIDVSRLEPGMYLLRIIGRDGIFSKLFVKSGAF